MQTTCHNPCPTSLSMPHKRPSPRQRAELCVPERGRQDGGGKHPVPSPCSPAPQPAPSQAAEPTAPVGQPPHTHAARLKPKASCDTWWLTGLRHQRPGALASPAVGALRLAPWQRCCGGEQGRKAWLPWHGTALTWERFFLI